MEECLDFRLAPGSRAVQHAKSYSPVSWSLLSDRCEMGWGGEFDRLSRASRSLLEGRPFASLLSFEDSELDACCELQTAHRRSILGSDDVLAEPLSEVVKLRPAHNVRIDAGSA